MTTSPSLMGGWLFSVISSVIFQLPALRKSKMSFLLRNDANQFGY